jgi:hypothetical protein
LVRRGGIEGEGAWSDRGSEAFLLRRLERTFPFSSIGARFAAADFLDAFAIEANITPPLSALYGKELRHHVSSITAEELRGEPLMTNVTGPQPDILYCPGLAGAI